MTVNADRMSIGARRHLYRQRRGHAATPHRRVGGRSGPVTDAAFALELSDAEIDRIFTDRINIGNGLTGPINLTADITPLNAPNIALRSGTDITMLAGLIASGAVSIAAGNNLLMTPAGGVAATALVV